MEEGTKIKYVLNREQQSVPIELSMREGTKTMSLLTSYHGCFEWANQIGQKEVDKSLIIINL